MIRVTIDGHLPAIQSLVVLLTQELTAIAEGAATPPRLADRRRIAETFLDEIWEATLECGDRIASFATGIGSVPNSFYFDVGAKTDLAVPMTALTAVLTGFVNGTVSSMQLIETLHTALEPLLRRSRPNRAKGTSFPELVRSACDDVLLPQQMCERLLELNRRRRLVKHRGQGVSVESATAFLHLGVAACQFLLAEIRETTGRRWRFMDTA